MVQLVRLSLRCSDPRSLSTLTTRCRAYHQRPPPKPRPRHRSLGFLRPSCSSFLRSGFSNVPHPSGNTIGCVRPRFLFGAATLSPHTPPQRRAITPSSPSTGPISYWGQGRSRSHCAAVAGSVFPASETAATGDEAGTTKATTPPADATASPSKPSMFRALRDYAAKYTGEIPPPVEVYAGVERVLMLESEALLESERQRITARWDASACDAEVLAKTVEPMVEHLDLEMLDVTKAAHSDIADVSSYLLKAPGKRFRAVLALLVNRLLDCSHQRDSVHGSGGSSGNPELLRQRQQTRMLEASELIHSASLMHDDVLDEADTRRGRPATQSVYGVKRAVLGGDFLLARACKIVASFGIPEVFARTAEAVESLVKGELLQAAPWDATVSGGPGSKGLDGALRTYLLKTYFKTASLMAEACACGALLGGHNRDAVDTSLTLGVGVGMAFQIHDDLADYLPIHTTSPSHTTGKPVAQDPAAGVITAPLLLSSVERPHDVTSVMRHLLLRKDSSFPGDDDSGQSRRTAVQAALRIAKEGGGILRTRLLLLHHVERVLDVLDRLQAPLSSAPPRGGSLSNNRDGANDLRVHARALAALLRTTLKYA
eukprot:GHVU01215330.1.p1 GENE.GHVU01215330.1~~GHVU01215330.1.p1  ORF type:complete len:600 (+),score=44.72 GHVU01215330.1:427-2226(+)